MRGKDDPNDVTEEDCSYMTANSLWLYFSPNCYAGGFDSTREDNFFAVYGALFEKLDREEEMEEQVGEEHSPLPPFGDAGALEEDVVQFYTMWENFVTIKPFGYADKYNPN